MLGRFALLLLTDARRPARVGAGGSLVTLEEHDRAVLDAERIGEGDQVVERALRLGVSSGPAEIAALHAHAAIWEATDRPPITG